MTRNLGHREAPLAIHIRVENDGVIAKICEFTESLGCTCSNASLGGAVYCAILLMTAFALLVIAFIVWVVFTGWFSFALLKGENI